MKLALGTVQFGLPYGIANDNVQLTEKDAKLILDCAAESGINTLDTAVGYGDSEQCLGNIGIDDWRIITKLPIIPRDCSNVKDWILYQVAESLARLKVKQIKGLLLHRPLQLLDPVGQEIWSTLQDLIQSGIVEKIGYSIYEPKELDQLWSKYQPNIIQTPFNVFDRRIKTSGWLKKMHNNNVEVHVRSIFLQGLLLMGKEKRPAIFDYWNPIWEEWDKWLEKEKLSPLEASLGFVNSESMVDRIVVGVDSLKQLKEIIVLSELQIECIPITISTNDQNLINPSTWNLQ
jgi:aryl-alcohol dehydrogenase-like predicted oxidoreductase